MANEESHFERLVDGYQEELSEFYHFGPADDLAEDTRLAALCGLYGSDRKLAFGVWINSALADSYSPSVIVPFFERGLDLKRQVQGEFGLIPGLQRALISQSVTRSKRVIGSQSQPHLLSGISVSATPEKMLTFLFAHRDLGKSEYFSVGDLMFRALGAAEAKDTAVAATVKPTEPEVPMHTALMTGSSLLKSEYFVDVISPEIDEA